MRIELGFQYVFTAALKVKFSCNFPNFTNSLLGKGFFFLIFVGWRFEVLGLLMKWKGIIVFGMVKLQEMHIKDVGLSMVFVLLFCCFLGMTLEDRKVIQGVLTGLGLNSASEDFDENLVWKSVCLFFWAFYLSVNTKKFFYILYYTTCHTY